MPRVRVIVREEPSTLELEINDFLKIEEIVLKDIKFSTHFDTYHNMDEYCAMIIYERKGE